MRRRSLKPTYKRSKGKANWTVENFAERVFISCPRVFSFSHRVLTSLRHPYLAVVVDLVDSDYYRKKSRVEELLGALLQSRDEEPKWARVASMFDSKLTAEEIDLLRRKVSLNTGIRVCIETIWAALGGVSYGVIKEEEYKGFHYKLYSYLLKIDNVSVVTSTSAAIAEDFMYDKKNDYGVTFGPFAISMLELTDNWTKTRDPDEYVLFLRGIIDRCLTKRPCIPTKQDDIPLYKYPVYFSGGLVCRIEEGDHVRYVKTKVQ
ncbi:hypothetical protein DQ04_00321310 [Trypanosoma grayi]|uniref:hypothetical protein n=1 Tax=Trypanosoma grayi TaxID=71804 RepID=UPI0004F43A47|nr:hypothetical protein DQ04_00321310 [Trypanosoma grayi]KEG14762.1 hypothetical protein DQ04_00321310 [Trypanosoma grayi]